MDKGQLRKNVLKDKSYTFALRVIKLYKHLIAEHKEFVLSKQVLRSSTSLGANIAESNQAQIKIRFYCKGF
jgi:four helix bundle protein